MSPHISPYLDAEDLPRSPRRSPRISPDAGSLPNCPYGGTLSPTTPADADSLSLSLPTSRGPEDGMA
eukprot:CAMPEP_0185362054 /NCGR_PEP_ID=MMETSP1364-20130426/10750_1 /TAXON_ID=38817 /ORGANISM="Gephyrocapsa oceanica, Strain RCC1303" /LENGTH=66 /DNA_ID=CAMNT_0027962413 /DNA_START=22 /DNA_END=222 /DNA_ORIENTATION=-